MHPRLLLVFLSLAFSCHAKAQTGPNHSVPLPPRLSPAQQWADSVYQQLSLKERIGQLFMVAAYSGGEKMNRPLIEQLIREQGIGGLI
ncbi:MAG: hypothetical protein ACR2IL_09910, partial [Chitinophagaceae bacterium]